MSIRIEEARVDFCTCSRAGGPLDVPIGGDRAMVTKIELVVGDLGTGQAAFDTAWPGLLVQARRLPNVRGSRAVTSSRRR